MVGNTTDLKDLLAKTRPDFTIQNLRDFTDWAEQRVLAGDPSSNLLILASLGLDKELVREEVQTYFAAYLKDIGKTYPDSLEATVYYFRRCFKILAWSENENVVWGTLIDTFDRWYDFDSPMLSRVVNYWNGVRSDFVDCFDEEYGYLHVMFPRHFDIPRQKQFDYIRETAKRFFWLLECEYTCSLILKNSS
ncbi:hypothetical protein KGP17_13660 [Serratia sp. JSRIV001]|uniref:hypothetical protein n=1 Tax=Serratia sp. JSRIV001 TaxID=2831893 RepID=UPI001CBF6DB0|nr:hypothetical protein [Serratia sp. JSRIV001]UAN43557.1 hypothetical protein KGP17_13660 [Serratia sp. JSRIV001]